MTCIKRTIEHSTTCDFRINLSYRFEIANDGLQVKSTVPERQKSSLGDALTFFSESASFPNI